MVMLVENSLTIKKDFKIHDGRQLWQKNRYQYVNQLICQSQYCLKQKVFKFYVYL